MNAEHERSIDMTEEKSFKFNCPHCGRHLEADYDMVGMKFDCPECSQSLKVPEVGNSSPNDGGDLFAEEYLHPSAPPSEETEPTSLSTPKITVIRKRERFIDRIKNRIKAVGIGVAVLLLFVGVGVIKECLDETETATATKGNAKVESGAKECLDETETATATKGNAKVESGAKVKAVMTSLECLLNYVEMPNERRLGVLSRSLEFCPKDFMDAVKEFLVSVSRTSDDMISDREREDMIKGKIALGLIFGAVNKNDPQSGVAAGLQLGDLISAKTQESANQRLKQDIESKLNHLLDVAERYGVDPNKLETALVSRMRQ